ncbi:MAG: hypothetical protein ACI8SC_001162, partial [Colwellia sp.]
HCGYLLGRNLVLDGVKNESISTLKIIDCR